MDPYGVQNEEICTRDPSGLAATSPQAGRSFWGRSQARGGVVRILRGEEFLGEISGQGRSCEEPEREGVVQGTARGGDFWGKGAKKTAPGRGAAFLSDE